MRHNPKKEVRQSLFVLAFFAAQAVDATHFMGGYFNVKQIGTSDTVVLEFTVVADPGGYPAGIALPIQVWLQTAAGAYTQLTSINLPYDTAFFWQGYKVNTYKTKGMLTAGNYRFVYEDCCRVTNFSNADTPFGTKTVVSMDYTKLPAGSASHSMATVRNHLPAQLVANKGSQITLFLQEVDGDSVFVAPDFPARLHNGGALTPVLNFTQLNNFGVYLVRPNGLIQWTPSQAGDFVTGYSLSEYRNGQCIGVNRIQHTYFVFYGNMPGIKNTTNIAFHPDSTVTITHDRLQGDSLEVSVSGIDFSQARLLLPGVEVVQKASTSWVLRNLTTDGSFEGCLRVANPKAHYDFPLTLTVSASFGRPEYTLSPQILGVFDAYGRFCGTQLDGLHGLYFIRYADGRSKKLVLP